MSFTIYAAIDLSDGHAVRLVRGDRSRMREVARDPLDLTRRLVDEGAEFIHLVDLDAAFGGSGNAAVIERILAAARRPVQVGGGVRDEARVRALRDAGAARVVLGTAAVRAADLVARLLEEDPEGVVVASDTRAGRVVVSGWTEDAGEALPDFAGRMRGAGARHLLVTSVERDGTGNGPDHSVLSQALAAFGPGVIASGGIGTLADVAALRPLAAQGLAGLIVGSVLVDGRLTPAQLAAAVAGWG